MNSHPPYERLIDFAAGEIQDQANHIARCPSCQITVTLFRNVRALLLSDDSIMPPAHIVARAYAIYACPHGFL